MSLAYLVATFNMNSHAFNEAEFKHQRTAMSVGSHALADSFIRVLAGQPLYCTTDFITDWFEQDANNFTFWPRND